MPMYLFNIIIMSKMQDLQKEINVPNKAAKSTVILPSVLYTADTTSYQMYMYNKCI